eukprot:TRINITY_DN5184_c0_g1_i1.p1 TRINITY_DN5184_c0_g1~~TRINITY_DN5184_c0_g1_i1.p1  ORF type:complete len:115 (+),score=17.21 TRINITY_DN5184_c0_g1_i1:86-430(+)
MNKDSQPLDLLSKRDDFRKNTNRIEVASSVEKDLNNNEFITAVQRLRRFKFPDDDLERVNGCITVNRKKVYFKLLEHPGLMSNKMELDSDPITDRIGLSMNPDFTEFNCSEVLN